MRATAINSYRRKQPDKVSFSDSYKMRRHSKKPYIKRERNESNEKKGSIPLEQIKTEDFYKQRIDLTTNKTCPKRKYACCISYFGTNYQGLQMNPDCKSIEAELERALFLAGCFLETNYGQLQRLQFTRAARTDKGVHAVG